MLEQYFVKPATIDRIRGSWIATGIETYLAWLVGQGYSTKSIWRRVPIAFAFGEFAGDRGARVIDDLPTHVEAFVADRVARHDARTGSTRPMAKEVRGPVEQMLSVVLPGFEPAGRPPARTSRDGRSPRVLPGRCPPAPDRDRRGVVTCPFLPAQGGCRRPPARLAYPAPLGGAAPRRRELRPQDHRRLRRAPLGPLHRGLRQGRRRSAARGRPRRRRGGSRVNDSLATAIADFLAHKRALGRKYHTEEATLRLLLAFAGQPEVENLRQLTPALLDAFIGSRPRAR